MNKNRNILIGVGIILSFALLIISTSAYYSYQQDSRQQDRLSPEQIENMSIEEIIQRMTSRRENQSQISSFYFFPFIAFAGVFVGTLVYYIMSNETIKKDKALEKNTKIILNFLTASERKVIETLLEKGGSVQQYELSHLPGLTKVKTHRILRKLEEKEVIFKEKLGKVNRVVLNKELLEVLKE